MAPDDWRNWRRRTWGAYHAGSRGGERTWRGAAPAGSRPRDLRSSYITVQIYAGRPLTEIARQVGTSVEMIDRHYAGVIANWDGRAVPTDEQIREARALLAMSVDVWWTLPALTGRSRSRRNPANPLKPTAGFEPATPSLRGKESPLTVADDCLPPATKGLQAGKSR